MTTAANGTKPAFDNVQSNLRSGDNTVRGNYDGAPEYPSWNKLQGLNDITDVRGMDFTPYANAN